MGGGSRFGRVLATLGLVALIAGASFAAGGGQSQSGAPVEAQVMRQLAQNGHASFFVVLRGNANLTAAADTRNRSRRGVEVYDTLTSFARESQAPLRAWLDARNIRYQPYWIVNAIFVKSADQAQLNAIAARPDVKQIRANHSYEIPKETVTRSKASPSTTEWGLNAINAPQVWSTFNDRGEGIVISSIDTGVRGSHEALVGQVPRKQRGQLRQQLQLVGSARRVPDQRPVRHERPRHTHDGHDGRRQRRLRARTRSASRRTQSGSRPRAACSRHAR